jgi:hypothetical protein
MLKRSIQVSVVKTPSTNASEEVVAKPYQDPELMNTIAKDFVRNAAITIGAAFAAKKVLDTACQIAIIAAKSKL